MQRRGHSTSGVVGKRGERREWRYTIRSRSEAGYHRHEGFPNHNTRGGSSRKSSTDWKRGRPCCDEGTRDDRVRIDDQQKRLQPNVMASAAIAPKCFYRLQGMMKRKYGASEVSSPFDCKRRRSVACLYYLGAPIEHGTAPYHDRVRNSLRSFRGEVEIVPRNQGPRHAPVGRNPRETGSPSVRSLPGEQFSPEDPSRDEGECEWSARLSCPFKGQYLCRHCFVIHQNHFALRKKRRPLVVPSREKERSNTVWDCALDVSLCLAHSPDACAIHVSLLLQSVREEHFYTRFALMSFELPRAKVGEAGWALKRFLSCSREGGFFGSLARGTPRESFRWSSRAVGVWRWRAKLVGEVTWLSMVKQVLSLSISRRGCLP
eukprot:scaffold801_cov381-Pavlova_lutheri.AAC.3